MTGNPEGTELLLVCGFVLADDPGATSRGGSNREAKMGHFYGWRVSSKTTIVIRDAEPVTLNSDRRRGRGLFVRGSGIAAH